MLLTPILRRWLRLVLPLALVVPVRAEFTPPEVPAGWRYHHDVEIGKVGDVVLRLELVAPEDKPPEPLPVIVYIHGGGWNHGSKDAHGKRLAGMARRGYVGVAISYRFAPKHSYPAQMEDVLAAIRFLKAHAAQYHVDPSRINLWGSSAGGHLASLAGVTANNPDVNYATHGLWEGEDVNVFAVVDFCGPNSNFLGAMANQSGSLSKFLGARSQSIPEKSREAMPITHVDAEDPPFFVAHGDADRTVPVTWSRDFVQALKDAGARVEYHELPGGGHNLSATHPEAQDLAYAFLDRLNFPERVSLVPH
ncbi:MAG: alpha/beta hydrolase [Verrucomicrobiota bacterium JB022]|nr:alpha/beta hydrolase [Verrucomicrobiota bacterium JB022]